MKTQSILVTGGSGTLGRAFTRYALAQNVWRRVICYSRDEWKQSQMITEFGSDPAFRAFIGDVRDYDRLRQACQGVDVVIAAAALKRVDATADNPMELLKTNVNGIENTIRAAADVGVKKVVVISSDKAVAPANPYGVSKAMAETVAATSNAWTHPRGTKVCAVRYGNVLGSRGSVVELWRNQMLAGSPITITDARMTRFAMTIEQAVTTVMVAMYWMDGGEIFIPVLPAVDVTTLAAAVTGGLPYKEIGLRLGGEKLHESLLSDDEMPRTMLFMCEAAHHYVVKPIRREWSGDPWPWLGTSIPVDRTYRSDLVRKLSVEEVAQLLTETEAGK